MIASASIILSPTGGMHATIAARGKVLQISEVLGSSRAVGLWKDPRVCGTRMDHGYCRRTARLTTCTHVGVQVLARFQPAQPTTETAPPTEPSAAYIEPANASLDKKSPINSSPSRWPVWNSGYGHRSSMWVEQARQTIDYRRPTTHVHLRTLGSFRSDGFGGSGLPRTPLSTGEIDERSIDPSSLLAKEGLNTINPACLPEAHR